MLVTERANAEAYKLRVNALSPLVLQQEWIAKWDGVLPQYMLGDKTQLMMGMKQ